VFTDRDLSEVEALLESAAGVVAMEDVARGWDGADVIGMRHDVDDNPHSLDTAVQMAKWEHERGWRSTYFLLHSADYFADDLGMGDAIDVIAGECGHEIGIHVNALAVALASGGDPAHILEGALNQLRSYGHPIIGMAAHGDHLCHVAKFVNDEMFSECERPEMGAPDRMVTFGHRRVKIMPRPLADFGLTYDTHRLPHGRYLSDSGGKWNEPFPGEGDGQLHMLWHSDWWFRAFHPVTATTGG
jgi:hypothetical protein